jgi:trk system potassium uptake protein
MASAESLSYAVRPTVVGHYLGQLLVLVGLLVVPPFLFALIDREFSHAIGYAVAIAVMLAAGLLLQRGQRTHDIQLNEAVVVVAAIFTLVPLIMAVPMMSAGIGFLDALFEAVSGITTTGLSTLQTIADKPASLLFTAAWLQWLGGIGIMVLSFTLLFGQSASAKRLTGVLGQQESILGGTRAYALIIIRVYLAMTVIGIAALWLAGAGLFSAVTLTLSSVSTGGFAPFDTSLAGVNGAVQTLVTLLCIAGAISIALFALAARGNWRDLVRDPELHTLLLAGLVVFALLAFDRWSRGGAGAHMSGLLFTAFSAQTTAGFSVAPVHAMDSFSKVVLIVSMLIGGSVGSSAGGIKLLRLLVLIKIVRLIILRTRLTPHAAVQAPIAGRTWADDELVRLLAIVGLFAAVIVLSWLPFLWAGYNPLDALFEVVSATGTVGLSTGISGPHLPAVLKGILCLDMLLGRLEILPLLVFLAPRTWIGARRAIEDDTKAQTKGKAS